MAGAKAHTGVEDGEVADVAAVHRELDQAPLLDRAADGRLVRPQIRGFGRDGDLLGLGADLKAEVDAELLVDL